MRILPLEIFAKAMAERLIREARPLNDEERAAAVEVFGASLDLDPIRIATSIFDHTPMTLANIVRLPPGCVLDPYTLIHELAHVWQYQNRGTAYISDSVWHQVSATLTTGSRNAAYEIAPEDLEAASIHDLTAEKQAVIIERWYTHPNLRHHPDYSRFLAEVRVTKPLPPSI